MDLTSASLYQKACVVCEDYFGPVGEQFMKRQIITHLGIEPSKITAKQLKSIINWIKPTFSLLTDNQKVVDAFVADLKSLIDSNSISQKAILHGKH